MIKLYPYNELGQADFGWLQARYHFSFANYHNAARMGLGALRVINDDVVQAGAGFDMHGHRDMEIITYVRSGTLTHKDSQGNTADIAEGHIQVMSAGSGIEHAEFNNSAAPVSLYQIWIKPRLRGVEPRWQEAKLPDLHVQENQLHLLVSGYAQDEGRALITIYQDASLYAGIVRAGHSINHNIRGYAYVLIPRGHIDVNGCIAKAGDGVEIRQESALTLSAHEDSEIIIIDISA